MGEASAQGGAPPGRIVGVAPSAEAGGDGLFAHGDIDEGEVLLVEDPIARLEGEAYDKQDTALLLEALGRLSARGELGSLVSSDAGRSLWRGPPSDTRRQAYRQCIDETWPEGDERSRAERAEAMTIFSYNSYVSQDEGRLQVVFPTISKANHACNPNTAVVAPEGASGQLVSHRRIAAGEEVTVSYLARADLLLPVSQRQSLLENGWEFRCGCLRCAAPADSARRFACAQPGCLGGCCALAQAAAPAGEAGARVAACDSCRAATPDEVEQLWMEQEEEVEGLIKGLPESLYSAWAKCEDFAQAHPLHGLSGIWKRYISRHTLSEIDEAGSAEEAADLRKEAALHWAAWQRCVDMAVDGKLPAASAQAVDVAADMAVADAQARGR